MNNYSCFRINISVNHSYYFLSLCYFFISFNSFSQIESLKSTGIVSKVENSEVLYQSPKEIWRFSNYKTGKNPNKLTFGIRSGLNVSNMNFNKGYSFGYDNLEPVWRSGFQIGLILNIPLNDRFLIAQEYSLSRVRGAFSPVPLYLAIDYLSIPLLLKYHILRNTSIFFGPHFELLIDGFENNQGKVNNISKTTEERSVGLTFGIEILFSNHIFFNGRYMHGLNAIGLWQRNSRREFKYEMFQMSLGYRFQ